MAVNNTHCHTCSLLRRKTKKDEKCGRNSSEINSKHRHKRMRSQRSECECDAQHDRNAGGRKWSIYAVRKTHTHGTHVFWQPIIRGRTEIPRGVRGNRKQENLLTAEEKGKKTKKDGAVAQNKHCQQLLLEGLCFLGGGWRVQFESIQKELFR